MESGKGLHFQEALLLHAAPASPVPAAAAVADIKDSDELCVMSDESCLYSLLITDYSLRV